MNLNERMVLKDIGIFLPKEQIKTPIDSKYFYYKRCVGIVMIKKGANYENDRVYNKIASWAKDNGLISNIAGDYNISLIFIPKKCINCSQEWGVLSKCARCGKVSYCSEFCQKDHWKTHKPDCFKEKILFQIKK